MPGRTCFQKLLGSNMCIASPLVIGLGIADVIITYDHYCSNLNVCSPLTNGIVLSWVAIGIWAPILTFFNGLFAVKMAGRCPDKGALCVLSFFNTFLFMPALIVVTALEIHFKFPSTPKDYNAEKAMFAIEIIIAVLGGVLLLHAFAVLHLNCCVKKCLAQHGLAKKPASKEQPQIPDASLGFLGPYQKPTQPVLQGQPQLQLLQGGVQPPQAGVYRLGYYQPGAGQNLMNRYYNGGNYQVPREVLAGARW